MDIDLELSAASNTNTGTGGGSNTTVTNNNLGALTTSKTTIQTRLQVPDECFAALTGMIQDTSAHNRVGIPCLGGLPIVGALFSDNLTVLQNASVIMFLKPTIIRTNDIYKQITHQQEDLFREQSNAEYYDKGINLVSTPDDS
jgi:type III secretion protein C